MAHSLLRTASTKDSLRLRRKVAAWDDDFLAKPHRSVRPSPDSPVSAARATAYEGCRAQVTACSLFDTHCNCDGVYDAGNFNDRPLLGLKGTMWEAGLHLDLKGVQREAGSLISARNRPITALSGDIVPGQRKVRIPACSAKLERPHRTIRHLTELTVTDM
jgi:hypothetical protein